MNLEKPAVESWKMGLIADLHFGLADDAESRLDVFMQDVADQAPGMLMQLGDFNYGDQDARICLEKWGQFTGPKHHVLGNHDMDRQTKPFMVDTWEMPNAYYSFDHQGWHIVVLDRNHLRVDGQDVPYAEANFYVDARLRGFADREQLDWLRHDLAEASGPVILFVHQGLGMTDQIDPDTAAGEIEAVLAEANRQRPGTIRACFCGHHHLDRYNYRDGIHYLWINSVSYHWVGQAYGRMAAYQDPLFTYLTFAADGSIEVQGCESSWVEPSPEQRGMPNHEDLSANIRSRLLPVGVVGQLR